MRRVIHELPTGFREAVVLRELEDLSYRDAAEVLDVSLGAFKTRLHRGRRLLRDRLEREGLTLAS